MFGLVCLSVDFVRDASMVTLSDITDSSLAESKVRVSDARL